MKKLTTSLLIILLGIVSCSPVKQNRYQDGTYTAVNSGCGYIITADGNVWEYFDRTIPDGSSVEFTILLFDEKLEPAVREWLDYGKYSGFGQWRNSGKGRYTWEEIK